MINSAAPGAGFHHSAKLCLVALTLGLLTCCYGAPSARSDSSRWWNQPCDTDLTRIRHGRSTSDGVTNVKNQLKIFNSQMEFNIKNINNLYNIKVQSGVKKTTPNAKLRWLKLSKMLKMMNKAQSVEQLLASFYDAAQRFAGTLEVLRHVEIKTSAVNFDQNKRHSIYQNITYQMRSLLCEIFDILKRTTVPKQLPLSDIINNSSFNHPLDLTAGHIIDINFLNKTKSFFKRTLKTLSKQFKKLKKNNSAKISKKTKKNKKINKKT